MKTRYMFVFLIVLVILVSGCAEADNISQTSTQVVEVTAESTQMPSPTLTLVPDTPTIEPTVGPTLVPSEVPTKTPKPTPTWVYSDPALDMPYFKGEELLDVLAMAKAICINDLLEKYPQRASDVMNEKGITRLEAADYLCEMPVTTCSKIPNPYVKIPILNLGEVWAEGIRSSEYADEYTNLSEDEFVPGEQYCFFGVDTKMVINPERDRNSLCPDPLWNERGIPSHEAYCFLATISTPVELNDPYFPDWQKPIYSGKYAGSYFNIQGIPADAWYQYWLTDSLAGSVGLYDDYLYTLEGALEWYSQPGGAIVMFAVPRDAFLMQFGWNPLGGAEIIND